MKPSRKRRMFACAVAILSGAIPGSVEARDFRDFQRDQIEFLRKHGAPARLTPPPAAATASHARPPARLPEASATTGEGTAAPPIQTAPGATAGASTLSTAAFVGGTTAVYFSAHPDDFLLFSFPYRDVAADARAVFIFVTAGDAGLGVGPKTAPYYLARENAAIQGIRFMADAMRPWAENATAASVTVNGRSIYKYSYRSSVAYFLRLPDGNGDGGGFPGTGNVSIAKLYTGAVSTLKAINGSTTYRGWSELAATVTAIVKIEAAGNPNVWVNANDYDALKNPNDHSDHYATGALALKVQEALPCVNGAYHIGYSLAGVENLGTEDVRNKTGSFASYATGLNAKNYFGAWDATHKSWLNGLAVRTALGNGAACGY